MGFKRPEFEIAKHFLVIIIVVANDCISVFAAPPHLTSAPSRRFGPIRDLTLLIRALLAPQEAHVVIRLENLLGQERTPSHKVGLVGLWGVFIVTNSISLVIFVLALDLLIVTLEVLTALL